MYKIVYKLLLLIIVWFGCTTTVLAQSDATDENESSEQTEDAEEAYRRQMELEGGRDQDTYANTTHTPPAEQEAIDKLPKESQENIRNQIMDVLIESDGWEPSDVLEEYPYEPTEAAKKDSVLLEQEQEAWDEQIDKYHEREAGAFGASRPPPPGGQPQQGEAGQSGDSQQEGEGSAGQSGGQSGDGQSADSDSGSAGSYQPGSRQDGDEVSTAGVEESALDFLRGKQARGPGGTAGNGTQSQPPAMAGGSNRAQEQGPEAAGAEDGQQSRPPELADSGEEQQEESAQQPSTAEDMQQQAPDGSLPIQQLDQLQGLADQSASGQTETPPAAEENQAQAADAAEASAQQEMTEASEQAEQVAEEAEEAAEQVAEASEDAQPESENQEQQSAVELDLSTPGIIAIRDLSKLEGVEDEGVDGQENDQP